MKRTLLLGILALCASISGWAQAPTVVTGSYVARGSSVAYGRSTISDISMSNVSRHGFCFATHPNPTTDDSYTTDYIDHNGYIYKMSGLTPATKYYVRAFATNKATGETGYGEQVKIYTLPVGTITWQYDNGADDAANSRINAAVKSAVEWWNMLTSIHGVNLNVHYGANTPTADCSYGGWMRVGPNASYQRTGTILHEALHAVGVGTHQMWYSTTSPLRKEAGRGDWLGDRATEVLRFIDNDPSATLHGDNQHMWPYGINGAQEDNGTELLYTANGLICQALGEDDLPPSNGFATPAYTFSQDDSVKYYLRSEDSRYGLTTAFLREYKTGQLRWIEMSGEAAMQNDSCAWTITYNPANCYYQFKNVATGKYISYDAAMKKFMPKAISGNITANENIQMMKGRVNVLLGGKTLHGYWLCRSEDGANPSCLTAGSINAVKAETFNIGNEATQQRWVILTGEEVTQIDNQLRQDAAAQLTVAIAGAKQLLATPHTATSDAADTDMQAAINNVENELTADNLNPAQSLNNLYNSVKTFLSKVTPSDINHPFNLTFMMSDADIETTNGWSETQKTSQSCVEWTAKAFDFNQAIANMPKGTYRFDIQAFQRPGTGATAIADYKAGNNNVNAYIYINVQQQKLTHICADLSRKKLGGSELSMGNKYMPNNMIAARAYFDNNHYNNNLIGSLTAKGELKIGVKCNSNTANYWTVADNAQLYFYGTITQEEVANGIENVQTDRANEHHAVYNLNGIKVANSYNNNLPAGIYIIDHKRIVKP